MQSNSNARDAEQSDLWKREEYLDPAWQLQQIKTFTAWCNSHLRHANTQIETVERDFQDGSNLLTLLEVISGENPGKPDRGKMRFHKIATVNKALEFIMSKGVKLVSIGAEEIVDGNVKMTLGMIWTIILRFAIQNITVEELTAKEGLLLWCQRQTAPYKNVHVTNFHTSFNDGLAFCALIHRHRPDLIQYESLSKDNPLHNLNYAFDVAAKHLDIPRMLDPADMVNNVKADELSVMAYVSSYYHAFSGAQKAETAANRISKVLRVNIDNDKLIHDYETLSSSLLKWIEEKLPFLQNRKTDNTLAGAQAKMQQFRDYRRLEKPPKLEEKARVETTFSTLQTRLRLSNRPAYMPEEGKLVSDIATRWRELENYEKGFEEWLLNEMKRLEQSEDLAKKFHLRCNTHEAWSKGKLQTLTSEDYKSATLAESRAMLKKHEAFESDLGAHQSRVESIVRIADELKQLQYHAINVIMERRNRVTQEWDEMGRASVERRNNLQHALNILEKIDQLDLEFAKRGVTFNQWLEQSLEDMQDIIIVHTVEAVEDLLRQQEKFHQVLSAKENEMKSILDVSNRRRQLVLENKLRTDEDNPYSSVTPDGIASQWSQLMQLVPQHDQLLQTELTRQRSHENLRRKFAELANNVGPKLESMLERVNTLITTSRSPLEEQRKELAMLEKEALSVKPTLEEVEKCSQSSHEALVFDNVHTRYTMEALHVGWEQLLTTIRRSASEMENQILIRDSKGISTEQMNDFRRSFNHFDKQHTRTLEPKEFKACLVSLGYNLREDKQISGNDRNRRASISSSVADKEFQKIMQQVDPNGAGYVTFDAFLDFMTREVADTDSSEQLLDSFRTLADGKPYITASKLRRELPADQAEYCIQHMPRYKGSDAEEDALDYTLFTATLYGESDM